MDPDPTIVAAVESLPLGPLRESLGAADAYLVGGWVRELIAGRVPGGDIDVTVDGDLESLIENLDPALGLEVHERHRRFGTATVKAGGLRIDLARARRERYASPGALPDVEPATIDEDLARRDFTLNSMAISLRAPHDLLDPFGGAADARSGILRVLHADSFVDDPTRAIRAARYASRLGLEPDQDTLDLLRAAGLGTVSADRRRAELARLAAEPTAPRGFALLAGWGVIELGARALELIAAVDARAAGGPWGDDPATRGHAIMLAACGGERAAAALKLSRAEADRPSEGVRLAAGHARAELLLAAAAGAGWLDDYLEDWSSTTLEIDGEDLVAAGVPEGPAVGVGLRGALERKLDGGLGGGREAELELALALARRAGAESG